MTGLGRTMTDVEASLNHYSKEVDLATYTFFVWKSINNIAVGDKEILTALRRNALSWGVITHSLQCTFFICLGRIFDDRKDSFSRASCKIPGEGHLE